MKTRISLCIILTLLFLPDTLFPQTNEWLWSHNTGPNVIDGSRAIRVDAAGNSYITGFFSNFQVTFGNITLQNSGGSADIYIVKYAPDGTVLWARSAGGDSDDESNGLTLDDSANIYITGYFSGDSISFDSTSFENAGIFDMFLAKYDSSGAFQWARSIGNGFMEVGNAIVTYHNGNVFVAGTYDSDTLVLGTDTLLNRGSTDIFLLKYTSDGTLIWARSEGGADMDMCNSLTTDPQDNVVFSGYFSKDSLVIGADTLFNPEIFPEVLIVKYSSQGNVIWARTVSGDDWDEATCVASDINGNIYIGGFYWSNTINFDTIQYTGTGGEKMFLMKLDSSGEFQWVNVNIQNGEVRATSLFTDQNGNVLVGGIFRSPSISFGTTVLNNEGESDIFLAEYDGNGNINYALSEGGDYFETCFGVSKDSFGNIYVNGTFTSSFISFGSTNTLFNNTGSTVLYIAKYGETSAGVGDGIITGESKAFPNPFSDLFSFQLQGNENTVNVEIINSMSEVVHATSITGKNTDYFQCRTSNLKPGIYFVKVESQSSSKIFRMIKE